jgi:hypothetical protein
MASFGNNNNFDECRCFFRQVLQVRPIPPLSKPAVKKMGNSSNSYATSPLEGSVVDLISGIEQQDNFNKQFKYRKKDRKERHKTQRPPVLI